ncbi:MAG: IPT/TIG domain-containing protein [Ginsengibacter sp.]
MKSMLFAASVLLLLCVISCQKEPSIDTPVVIDSTPVVDTMVLLRIFSINPDSARAGDTIVVTGTGFNSIGTSGTITINGASLSVINLTDTTLTLKLPAEFTSGPISIMSGDTSIISSGSVTVLTQDPVTDSASAWVQKADIQFEGVFFGGTLFSKGFAIDGKGYFLTSILRQFDPILNKWVTKPAPPIALNIGFAFVLNGKLFAGCSADANGFIDLAKQVWQYDPATETWTRKADFPGTDRTQPYSFSTTTYGYIGGGYQNLQDPNSHEFWRYNAENDSWKQMRDYPGTGLPSFEQFTAFTLNNAGYVFEAGMGNTMFPTGFVHNATPLWMYNETNDTWVQKASFDKVPGFVSPTIFSIGTSAYIIYGLPDPPVAEGVSNNFWEYNSTTNSWLKRTDVPFGQRFFGRSFTIGNKGYVGLGVVKNFSDLHADFWEYTPE